MRFPLHPPIGDGGTTIREIKETLLSEITRVFEVILFHQQPQLQPAYVYAKSRRHPGGGGVSL